MPGGVRKTEELRPPGMFFARGTGEGGQLCHSPGGMARRAEPDSWLRELRPIDYQHGNHHVAIKLI